MIELLVTAINFPLTSKPDPEVKVTELPEPKFYIHFDSKTLDIRSVSARAEPVEGQTAIEVTKELGEALMMGTQSVANFQVMLLKNESHELVKKDVLRQALDRVDIVKVIYEVGDDNDAMIEITAYPEDDMVEIFYNGDMVKQGATKFYFTRFDDPSFLKCAFQLDVNTLNHMAAASETSAWPNPVKLKIKGVNDLSVYGIKGQNKASIRYA